MQLIGCDQPSVGLHTISPPAFPAFLISTDKNSCSLERVRELAEGADAPCSIGSLQGLPHERRMKPWNRSRAEKSKPGAIAIPFSIACSARTRPLLFPGSSIQRTNPPVGREMRVPAGNDRGHRFADLRDLAADGAAQAAEVVLVAAGGEELGDRHLQERGRGDGVRELEREDLFAKLAGRDPADAIPRRERLGERAAEHDQAAGVEGLGCPRAFAAVLEIAIDVVFDERKVAAAEHLDQPLLRFVRHAGAARVREIRHRQHRRNPLRAQHFLERIEIHSLAGQHRNFDDADAEALDQLEEAVVGGRFDGDHIARLGDRAQREVRDASLAPTVVTISSGASGQPRRDRAARDLAAQQEITRRRIVADPRRRRRRARSARASG